MTILVADVGGTNTRLALTRDGGGLCQVTRLANDDYRGFPDLLAHHRARHSGDHGLPPLAGCCIAVAGPVTAGRARLTNRDWEFDRTAIADALGLPGAAAVRLVNDLAALGHALPALEPSQMREIRPAEGGGNDQALVAGLGTGFNICLVKPAAPAPVVIEAEMGHASPPANVTAALRAAIGPAADGFATVEDLFSGRGLARLHAVVSGGRAARGQDILAGYDPARRDHAAETVELAAGLLGLLARELVFHYLPFGGLHFAGGAARGLLGAAVGPFLDRLASPGPFADHVARVPVRLITDDAAALTGLARLATARAAVRTA